ncbi:MAG: glycosyltransferase family 2 protein [Rhodothermales bacterium]
MLDSTSADTVRRAAESAPDAPAESADAPLDVSVVVPVYDEEQSLPELADQIRSTCSDAGLTFEVWFVDDGSRDASWSVITRLHEGDPRFRGLRFRRNYGKSAALALGFERASGSYVVTMDADLQDDPAEIPNLVAKLKEGYDLVSGWKKTRHDPIGKRVPSKFFNAVTRVISGIPLHDFNCGLKAYHLDVVKSVNVYGELHRYIPLLAKWEGYDRISEMPVRHRPREYGRSKFGLDRFIKGFLDLISVVFLTRFAARPMHFFGTFGTLAFVAGLVVSCWISIDKIVFGNPIGDRPLLLLGVLMIIVGVQMFTTGLLGEMMIKREMEKTSSYHVTRELSPTRRLESDKGRR